MIARLLVELLAPTRCTACDEKTLSLFCAACAPTVEQAPDPRRAVFAYGGAVETAIHRYKFEGRPDLGRRLAGPLGETAAARVARPDIVVPVPLHPRRLVERGFDQAAILARGVATRLGVPLRARLLRRTRDTPKQSKLARAARLENLEGAFRCEEALVDTKILLVDDVETTGATLAACRTALIEAGAGEVTTLVLALRDDLGNREEPR